MFTGKPGIELPPEDWLRSIVSTALAAEKADESSEVSLVITDQEHIHELNRTYLGEDRPTDVLSFPMLPSSGDESTFVSPPDGLKHLGEIIISLPQAAAQAVEHGQSLRWEVALLVTHGVLHLLGYDHANPEEERQMKEREKAILALIENL